MPKLGFDDHAVTQLVIAKSDPKTGDHWVARLKREEIARGGSQDPPWRIESDLEGAPLGDRLADGGFILHLLDSLRSLALAPSPIHGPPASFGLAPPRFALQWKADRQYEMRLGNLTESGDAFAILPGLANDRVYVASGSTLKLLEMLRSEQALRQRSLSAANPDDFDEIEIRQNGRSRFYAQRDGDRWTNRSHRLVAGDIDSTIRGLLGSEIAGFVDDPATLARERGLVQDSPLFQVTLTPRHGQATRIAMRWLEDGTGSRQLFAAISSRPQGIFRIDPDTIHFVTAPGK